MPASGNDLGRPTVTTADLVRRVGSDGVIAICDWLMTESAAKTRFAIEVRP